MLTVDLTWVNACLLLWVRLAALLALSPLGGAAKAPPSFWVLFTLALAGLLSAALGLRTPLPAQWPAWIFQVLSEAGLGALLGLALHAAFAAWVMAGRLLDVQMGFGMSSVLDPVTRANAPVMGVALSLVGMAVFITGEGPQALLRGIAYSAQAVPPGGLWQLPEAGLLLRPVAAMFSAAVVVMAPVLFMLLMLELAMAVISRVLPQMNVLFVGMPAKILIGLLVLAIAAPGMGPAMSRSYAAIFQFWEVVLP
jgi:flagellar biosynthetic protein FliR